MVQVKASCVRLSATASLPLPLHDLPRPRGTVKMRLLLGSQDRQDKSRANDPAQTSPTTPLNVFKGV